MPTSDHFVQLKGIVFAVMLALSITGVLPLSAKEIRKDSTLTIRDEKIGQNRLREILMHYDERFPVLKFSHCTFEPDEKKDVLDPFPSVTSNYRNGDHVFYELSFDSCIWKDFGLTRYWFHKDITFIGSSDMELTASQSYFGGVILLMDCELSSESSFSDSYISSIWFKKCRGFARFTSDSFFAAPETVARFYFDEACQFKDLVFDKCEFFDDSEDAHKFKGRDYVVSDGVYFAFLNSERLSFTNCLFYSVLYLREISVTHSFTFKDNDLKRAISFDGNNEFPLFNTTINYEEISGKIFTEYQYRTTPTTYYLLDYLSEDDYGIDGDDGELFSDAYPTSPFQSEPTSLIATYSKLLTIFRNNNDDDSYNACYKQVKAIETMEAKVKYKNHPTLEAYFGWMMNRFLDKFCDYGTNPVKSLVFSVNVILFFCLVYIVFPSEDDNLKYRKLTGAISRYIHHFANKHSIREQSDNSYKAELSEINQLREELKANATKLPPIVVLFGKPLHGFMAWVARVQHRARNVVEFNIYHDWHSQSRTSKWKTSFIITASLTGFLLWGLIMRMLNAVALSMNAFVTLGYGEIEASGVARYFCVLEGLVGWFLLSIFSVSLISQILQ